MEERENRGGRREQSVWDDTEGEQFESVLCRMERLKAQLLHSEKMASVGQLAAGVAHEINNPTGFIRSNLKTLQTYQRDIVAIIQTYRAFIRLIRRFPADDRHDRAMREALEEIEKMEQHMDLDLLIEDMVDLVHDCCEGADRIKRIVLDLKRFAHPGDDRMQLIDINAGLESTLNVVHHQLKYKAAVEKCFEAIPPVLGFPQQLNQVFMNVLINAAQAIEKKGVIKLETRVSEEMVEVLISDDGCGMAPDHVTKIFEPLFTTKAVGEGTGLGMHIAYDIIKNHQGTIGVKSELGRGTTFKIRLPAADDRNDLQSP